MQELSQREHYQGNEPNAFLLPTAISVSLLFRLGLLFLPAPGRDEATYYFWSQHNEPAYAFLLQILIKLCLYLPLSDIIAMRMPSFLGGILVAGALHTLLKKHNVDSQTRHILLATVILTPWQIYVGSILHPDSIFLAVLLLAALAASSKNHALFSMCVALSVLAKPTGVVILPVGLLYIFMLKEISFSRKILFAVFILAIASPALLSMNKPMLAAMAEFGKISGEISGMQVLFITLVSLFGLGGMTLPYAGLTSIRREWQNALKHILKPGENSFPLLAAASLLITFGAAALLRNQIKGNWLLPAFVLLLPYFNYRIPKILILSNFLITILISTGMALFFIFPDSISQIKKYSGFIDKTYASQAGTREEKISTTSSWHDRMKEYQSIDPFTKTVQNFWQHASGASTPPTWIISDDYGLAAQLAYRWNKCQSILVIPADGIFFRFLQQANKKMHGSVLVLAVHKPARKIWQKLPEAGTKEIIRHPITNSNIELAVVHIADEGLDE